MILLKILNEKMKKVLFLMLFLIALGTASVKAQVRIGGNTAPNAAAVLDLNADNTLTPTGNKGALALPRVSLTSATTYLNSNIPLLGMMVYNTNDTLGAGIYAWTGATSGGWKRLYAIPATVRGDSGHVVISNGTGLVISTGNPTLVPLVDTVSLKTTPAPVSLSLILDTTVTTTTAGFRSFVSILAMGLTPADFCFSQNTNLEVYALAMYNQIVLQSMNGYLFQAPRNLRIRCFRPSI